MRYSSGYLWLLSLNSRYRYLYTSAACALLLVTWLFLWYLPSEKHLLQIDLEIKQLKKDSDQFAEQKASCKKLSEDVALLQQDMAATGDATVADYISVLMRYTNDAGMKLISLRATEQKDHAWYTSAHTAFDAVGTFATVVKYFQLLAEHQMLVQCDDFSLHRQADDTFLLHCIMRQMLPKSTQPLEIKSPSTLKKS